MNEVIAAKRGHAHVEQFPTPWFALLEHTHHVSRELGETPRPLLPGKIVKRSLRAQHTAMPVHERDRFMLHCRAAGPEFPVHAQGLRQMRHKHLLESTLGIGEGHRSVIRAKPHEANIAVGWLSDDCRHHVRGIEAPPMLVVGQTCAIVWNVIEAGGRSKTVERQLAEGVLLCDRIPLAQYRLALVENGQVRDQSAIGQATAPHPEIEGNEALQVFQHAETEFVGRALRGVMVKFQQKIADSQCVLRSPHHNSPLQPKSVPSDRMEHLR